MAVTTLFSARRITARWRVVDIIVAAVIGVAAGVVFFGWDQIYAPVTAPFTAVLPGSGALLYAVWLFAGVLGGLVVRKPGAALFTEVVAAVVEALLGASWGGFQTILSGVIQGAGAELVFLIFAYATWNRWVAVLAGAGAAVGMVANDLLQYDAAQGVPYKIAYIVGGLISGAVIAGLGSWYLTRALAKTGALARFASGRTK
ncbi:ECF transporter S component [Galbitalea soli]|uniref:ECF transporter S component n=1 Tax=Galbitalea soli TaxID=1268042 RepID=A0A7C9PNU3_9MICO|nr:ECF transporter S component [Galbitalea soli]NEM91648.1 hypothetical protein [Galbitalea soli]NYJ30344.1 energy-coupling factor transport system substrate-specific component [Galbitalea soli]